MSADLDLEGLERTVQAVLTQHDGAALHVLGYGEISPVVAWPSPDGPWACKRLPVFDDGDQFASYRSTFDDYVYSLTASGIVVHATRLERVPLPDGRIAAYCVQPALGAERFGPALLRNADPTSGRALLAAVLDHVAHAVTPAVGLDAQISNWASTGDHLVYVDLTTPLLRDAAGHERLDTDMFLASLPAAFRPIVRRFFLEGILAPYYTRRAAALDLLSNLHKEGLSEWVTAGIDLANKRFETDLGIDEVRRYYRTEARLWGMLQRMRRVDRSWQRHVRRRTYPFLLPGRIDRRL
jgi:Family of unknown function (DUF6206)